MGRKHGHVRNRAEGSTIQRVREDSGSTSNPIVPTLVPLSKSDAQHPSGSYKEVEAIEKVSQDSDFLVEKRYKKQNQRLQVVGLVVAIVTILLTYWNMRLQASNVNLQSSNISLQSSLSHFEKNQRVVEMSVSLATFWEHQLDPETRYRGNRFISKLKSLKSSPKEQKEFLSALLDPQNVLNPEPIKGNQHLKDLVNPKFSPDSGGLGANPGLEASKYKSTLIRMLNTMEVIAIVNEHTEDNPEAQKVLASAYAGTIKQRYDDLKPFVEAYREKTKDGRDLPAWQPIDDMMDRLKNQERSK